MQKQIKEIARRCRADLQYGLNFVFRMFDWVYLKPVLPEMANVVLKSSPCLCRVLFLGQCLIQPLDWPAQLGGGGPRLYTVDHPHWKSADVGGNEWKQ